MPRRGYKGNVGLLDELPNAVIEGLIDYAKEYTSGAGGEDLNSAIIKYGEYALEQARECEHRLLAGITGEPPKKDTRMPLSMKREHQARGQRKGGASQRT